MPKTIVEIEWDEPSEYEEWLCPENIAFALRHCCTHTNFKVKKADALPPWPPEHGSKWRYKNGSFDGRVIEWDYSKGSWEYGWSDVMICNITAAYCRGELERVI